MRTVYSELRGRIVDDGVVGRRVTRGPAPNDTQMPYVEIVETSPVDRPIRDQVERTFEVNVYQLRGKGHDASMALRVTALFHRQRWDYWQDDGETTRRRIITRVPSRQVVDRPEDGVMYDQLTVVVRCGPDQP